jgi:uncharacterized membrane protein YccF (DUF307 family)
MPQKAGASMKKITLPIKCSTVKKVVSASKIVLCAGGAVLSAVLFIYGVLGVWLTVFHYAIARQVVDPFVTACGLVMPLAWYLFAEPYLPEITCIKDEEQP